MPLDRVLIDPFDLTLPNLPLSLEGFRIVHLSDLHIHRHRGRHRQIAAGLDLMRVDLAVLTGDYIDRPGDEEVGLKVMGEICGRLRPRLGTYGVFGNHDTPTARRCFESLPVHWLNDTCHGLSGVPLQLVGMTTGMTRRPDVVETLLSLGRDQTGHDTTPGATADQTVRVLLSHLPTYLPTAADLGVDLMFSGHTHGGQCRLPRRRVLYNSCDLPLGLTSGLLRHRDTLCAVSRGLGETILPIRAFCPPHLPVYTLRRGPMPGRSTDHVVNVMPW